MLVFFGEGSFVGFCLHVQILISQMNTNIYSADVCAAVTSDAFQLSKSLLEQQVAKPRRSKVGDGSVSHFHVYTHIRTGCHKCTLVLCISLFGS